MSDITSLIDDVEFLAADLVTLTVIYDNVEAAWADTAKDADKLFWLNKRLRQDALVLHEAAKNAVDAVYNKAKEEKAMP